ATFDSTFSSAHTIEINDDGYDGYIYVNGPVNPPELGGVHILDIHNPAHPVEVGEYSPTFIHDCIVKGNFLYAMNSPNQTIDVLDISDRTNPKLKAQIACCANVHSGDATEDGKFIFVTTEITRTPAHVFDVEDLSNINEVAQYIGEDSSIVHNAYIKGVCAYVSDNNGGLRVVDLSDPAFPVEVGYYDTYTGFNTLPAGLFTDYPFFPSGKIIANDRQKGLFVFRFNQAKPVRIYCHVEDSDTQLPIFNATVTASQTADTGATDIFGNFKTSFFQYEFPAITLTVKAEGYDPVTLSHLVNNEDSIHLTARLRLATNVTNPSDSALFNIFPTLAHQMISVLNKNRTSAIATLKIFNSLGELVKQFSIPENNQSSEVNLSYLPNGIYFAQLSEENQLLTRKIILQ
ncbi:MAG: choice-of-anchor B family protein, partial [Chitinophagales bacterium]